MLDEVPFVIDIGGTWIRVGVAQESKFSIFEKGRTSNSLDMVLETILALMSKVMSISSLKPSSIVVGASGLVDFTGTVVKSLYTPLESFNIKTLLENQFNCTVQVLNDADLQIWGVNEHKECTVLVSVGTGVGGAVSINGYPYRGARGFASEIGHAFKGVVKGTCKCGSLDCIDLMLGGRNLEEKYEINWCDNFSLTENVTIFQMIEKGYHDLIYSISGIYDPYKICFSGHIFKNKNLKNTINHFAKNNNTIVEFYTDSWRLSQLGALNLTRR